ncbi:MAG: TetR family transcriptional regulator, partial [Ilumatobacter sp.]|nr:TetR family transcriptional regulator [Ilumatobacter sp.]
MCRDTEGAGGRAGGAHGFRCTVATSLGHVSAATVSRLDDVGHALLDAADRLLTTEGAGALTIRRMASEAGVSTMNVYSR